MNSGDVGYLIEPNICFINKYFEMVLRELKLFHLDMYELNRYLWDLIPNKPTLTI